MKTNKCLQLGIIGTGIFIFGAVWDVLTTMPDILRNIVLNITFPPTYQILELMGIVLFTIALYCKFKACKVESEEETTP